MKQITSDITIIGSGFFGLYIAEFYAKLGKKVVILEKEQDAMQRASLVNQARVHNGYHYPRSILTALRSRISFPRFVDEFDGCIYDEFNKYYLIANGLGKVTSNQFEKFCERIGAPCEQAPEKIRKLTNPKLIDSVYTTTEYAFDSTKLKNTMLERVRNKGVDILFGHTAEHISYKNDTEALEVKVSSGRENLILSSKQVFNCTYSMLNYLLDKSQLDLIDLRHEMTEMCIVDVPPELQKVGFTVMCGPFFSVMPFPVKKAHSLSHVRYTPHFEWNDSSNQGNDYLDAHDYLGQIDKESRWKKMVYDAKRYIPILEDLKYKESLWEVKTILPRSDSDDSRPILFRDNYILPGFHCIMGGKIDNIYDVIDTIKSLGLDK